MAALLVICACGRLHFEADDTPLSVTSPAEDAEVEGPRTATRSLARPAAVGLFVFDGKP